MGDRATKPTRRGYWVAGFLLVGSIGVGGSLIVWFVLGVLGVADGLERVVIPTGGAVTLAEPGTYTVFYEHKSVVGGQHYNTSLHLPIVTVEIRDAAAPGASPLPLRPPFFLMNYNTTSYEGESVWSFDAPAAGTYRVDASYANPTEPPRVLAIGKGLAGDILRLVLTIFGGVAVLGLGVIAAFVVWLVTFIRRRRAA